MDAATQQGSRWRGKVALVTGASSGIGEGIARRLAAEGMKVVATGRRMKKLEGLEHEVEYDGLAGAILPLQVDLRDEGEILDMFRAVKDHWGGVDVLVNNAGLGHLAPLVGGRTEHWREMLEVNIMALCICTREAVKDLLSRNAEGHVVHLGSLSGHRVPGTSGVYAATKHAVVALTEALRLELRELGAPIRVSAISPGFVRTEFAEKYHGSVEAADKTYGRYPVLAPEDVAEAVWYVLGTPPHVQIHDLLLRPTAQPY